MKRILIITYYWPPAGGPGVQRWLKFVKYLKEFGIQPIIYAPLNPHYPIVDHDLMLEIPDGIKIIKQPIKEPYRFARILSKKKTKRISSGIILGKKQSVIEKILLYIRGNYFIPDARIGWVKPSVTYLCDYLNQNPVDTIITTGPPHSTHLIGMAIKEKIECKWIADFRDPWTTIHYHKSLRLSKNSRAKHKNLERKVLRQADRIIVTSPTTKKEFEQISNVPILVITNGFDIEDNIVRKLDEEFTLAHIGSLLSERNPKVLWKVLSEIIIDNTDFAKNFRLKLVGSVSDEVLRSISDFGLNDHCVKQTYVSHLEAIQTQYNAQVLLLVEMDHEETRAIIPGKIFEYLAAMRPIIALGPEGSDIEGILRKTNNGTFYSYSQAESLKAQILQYFNMYKEGALNINSNGVDDYSRRTLTKKLSEFINS